MLISTCSVYLVEMEVLNTFANSEEIVKSFSIKILHGNYAFEVLCLYLVVMEVLNTFAILLSIVCIGIIGILWYET